MTMVSRRSFVQLAGAACIAGASRAASAAPEPARQQAGKSPIRMGVVVWVRGGETPEKAIARVHELGFPTCQVGFETVTPQAAKPLKDALNRYGIEATAVLTLGPGPMVWNFYKGPLTIGLIPPATRQGRIEALKIAADVASECNIQAVHTHCGFMPENPNNPVYKQAVLSVRDVASYCREKGRMFFCEAGQETPITLLRLIEDVGLDNVFVNLDMANLILYGKGNPVDAMDVIGRRVRGLHAKDGLFPTSPRELGEEVPIGKGKVDFRRVIERLRDVNYRGPMTIEREIEGKQQTKDILVSKAYLEGILAEVYGSHSGSLS